MKVKFEADYKDFAETNYEIWKKEKSSADILFPYLITSICIAGISCIPAFVFASNKWAGGLTFFIIFLLSLYFHRIPTKSYFFNEYQKRFGNKLYEIEIEFLDEGVRTKQLGNEIFFNWENLRQVRETDERLFLFMNLDGGVSIPLKAFEYPAQLGQFVAFAKSRLPSDLEISK